jgi:hypothetical protein
MSSYYLNGMTHESPGFSCQIGDPQSGHVAISIVIQGKAQGESLVSLGMVQKVGRKER